MKKITIVFLLFVFLFITESCRRKGDEKLRNGGLTTEMIKDSTRVEFVETQFAFDTIKQGDKVEHTFLLKNVGDKNLFITNAFGSCGCTVPEYPKEPIAPGKTGEVKVTFNSAGKEGMQQKTITLTMNTDKRSELLYLNGFVKANKSE